MVRSIGILHFILLLNLLSLIVDIEASKIQDYGNEHRIGNKRIDYFEFRHIVAEGIQSALDECRHHFKWDRWNCPKKLFLDILNKNPLPANKELAYLRALISSSITLSIARSCIEGKSEDCGCVSSNSNSIAYKITENYNSNSNYMAIGDFRTNPTANESNFQQVIMLKTNDTDAEHVTQQFAWRGCDEALYFAFDVSKIYLDTQDSSLTESSKLLNAHNYRAGRYLIKKSAKRVCKCHGVSGSCQMASCWTAIPSVAQIGDSLRRQYGTSLKVGALSAEETDVVNLRHELTKINDSKLVFVDPSPDYCYENKQLGINGTLGRYCKLLDTADTESKTSSNRAELNSCDRLCTRCGYKIRRETITVERQCDCRFIFCCTVECKKCKVSETVYKCARHGY